MKPSDRAKNRTERVRKHRAKKRRIARIRRELALGRTDNPKGVFHPKVEEILAIKPNGKARNEFIQRNTKIITLCPYTNNDKTTGAKGSCDGRNKKLEDPLRVQQIIQVNLAKESEEPIFADRIIIKKSNIEKGGMGAFAAQHIPKGATVAVYGGTYHSSEDFRSEYYIFSAVENYGINGYCSLAKGNPILHGMHIANDYHLGLVLGDSPNWKEYKKMSKSEKYNMVVEDNFVFTALRDIEAGEELYYHYGWSEDDNDEEEDNDDDDEDYNKDDD